VIVRGGIAFLKEFADRDSRILCISDEIEDPPQAINALLDDGDFSHVEQFQAIAHSTDFEISYVEVDS
jgi:hypothetical protein